MIYAIEKLSGKIIEELTCLIEEQQIELWNDLDEKINLNWDTYYNIEEAGLFYLFTVRDEDRLIGYCSFIVAPDLHYMGRLSAMQDSIFVLKDYRSKGVGGRLIDFCDDVLEKDFKVTTIHHSVNIKVDFSPLLERKGYVFTEKMMIRRIK